MRFIDLVSQNYDDLIDMRIQYNKVNLYMLWQRKITNQDVDINDEILTEVLEKIENKQNYKA